MVKAFVSCPRASVKSPIGGWKKPADVSVKLTPRFRDKFPFRSYMYKDTAKGRQQELHFVEEESTFL